MRVVFEADDQVGGIAGPSIHDGYRFDLGGHRFFTKVEPVERLWEEILGSEFLAAPASPASTTTVSFFSYPLRAEGRRATARRRRVAPLRRSRTRGSLRPRASRRRSRTG